MLKCLVLTIQGKTIEALERTAPTDQLEKLLKLHGTDFQGKTLIIEKAKTPQKAQTIDRINTA